MPTTPRSRPARIALIALAALVAIGSRRFGDRLPGLLAAYAGDTLWATALFLALGLVRPRARTAWLAGLALAIALAVELGQLWKAPWLEAIRRTTVGGLLIGFDFAASDLGCYAVGVGLGVGVELGLRAAGGRAPGAEADRS